MVTERKKKKNRKKKHGEKRNLWREEKFKQILSRLARKKEERAFLYRRKRMLFFKRGEGIQRTKELLAFKM